MPVRLRLWARVLRWLSGFFLWAGGSILLLWLGFILGLHLFLSSDRGQALMRQWAIGLLSDALETEVELQRLRISGLAHLSLEGFVLYDKACHPFIRVQELRLAWYPSAFWRGFWNGRLHIPFSSLNLQNPEVYIYTEKASGLTNVDRLFSSSDTTPPKETRWEVSLASLTLRGGRFRWIDSTAKENQLIPRYGWLRYEHLFIDSLELESAVEWRANRYLFAQLKRLSLFERNSQTKLPSLELTLQGYPDSTIIPHFYIRLERTTITGRARFPYEGFDKLFRDTETKLFYAQLQGQIDWADIATFVGDSLPLRGKWDINLRLRGDLYHFHAERLWLSPSPNEFIEGVGEIVHYARPAAMEWKLTIQEAVLSLSSVHNALPDIVHLPDIIQTSHAWRIRGSHTGRLSRYTADIETPELSFSLYMERDTVWRYDLKVQLAQWNPSTLFVETPVQAVSGTTTLTGQGFSVRDLKVDVTANLSALDKEARPWHLETRSQVQAIQASGFFALETPYGNLRYRGSMPIDDIGSYEGEGTFASVAAQSWGSQGWLNGTFTLKGRGFPWEEGQATLCLSNILWRWADTSYSLGNLNLGIQNGKTCRAQGEALSIFCTADGTWMHALPLWFHRWIRGDTSFSDSLLSRWSLRGEVLIQDPKWFHLLGLSQRIFLHNLRSYFKVEADSSAPKGVIHLISDTLRLEDIQIFSPHLTLYLSGDSLQVELGSTEGQAYLAYEALHLHLIGTWREGTGALEGLLAERIDTTELRFSWHRTADTLLLQIEPRTSSLTLGRYRWSFIEIAPILIDLQNGDWSLNELSLAGQETRFRLSRLNGKLSLSIHHFPIALGAILLGIHAPLEGQLSLYWHEYEGGPQFALDIDSLQYEGQAYPSIQASGESYGDSIPFQIALRQGDVSFVQARGVYVLKDTINPLYAELRSLRIPAEWLNPFLNDYIQNLRGLFVSQRVIIRGKPERPLIFGEVFCNKLTFYMPITHVLYTVEGVLRLRGDTIIFPGVELRESRMKRSQITGYIALRQWSSPYLNLSLQVRDKPFLLAASSATTEAYIYGRADLEQGSFSITGPWNQPNVRGEVVFSNSTDITLPLRTYERSTGAEHVRFLKPVDTFQSFPQLTAPVGVDVRVAIRSLPETRFRLLFDERTGDEITAQGSANLLLSINRSGQTSLAGSYEVQGGEYRVNLQGIASKKLLLEPGSRITWDGDLYQGQMDLTATYRTFTSLRMIDTSFTYTLPVELKIFVRGALLSPTMKFEIDIPSLSGSPTPMVNLFLQRLATDEQERNRQVFALLVLGTFVPLEQGVGTQQVSSGVSSTLAEFLSAQLANWVGYTLGSQVGVSFALGEWNELSARLRLSLGQRFTLERDGVLIGPGQNTAALGNLSARYRLFPKRVTQPTQWQLEAEGFSRQTFMWGAAGATSQGAGLRLRKSFYLPERRRRSLPSPSTP
ncbi:MAG: translocation/assembly module TamB [Bacteroidia bacterium]|nr:translocation/assembly module TamB [Bacteroidia bacterium]